MGDTQRHKDLRMDGILLIEKAFMFFEDAKTHYENYDSNPNIVDKEICSFLLQRAIEDIIKGFLNYYYTDYEWGHGITINIKTLQDLQSTYRELGEIYEYLQILKTYDYKLQKWEKNNAYKGIKVRTRDVLNLFDVFEELQYYIKRHEEP